MQHSCSNQNHYKTHTQKPRKIAHTLCSLDIKYKIHESAHDKYFLDNVFTTILNRIIWQPVLNTSGPFSSPWTVGNYNSLYCTLQGICLSNMQQIDRFTWLVRGECLTNEISMTAMPEEYGNLYVKVDFVTVCCLLVLFYLLFFLL